MQREITYLPELKLIGITERTSNAREMDPETAKIFSTIQTYAQDAWAEKIPYRKRPGTTYCVYTQYESDEHGEYTYFVGEEVSTHEVIPEGLTMLIIPAQTYVKFTNEPGAMPVVCIDIWQKVWAMDAVELGGRRAYLADFEVYDERARDPLQTVLDIYVGIQTARMI
jgi:predicted transcriptional regulator YdeE